MTTASGSTDELVLCPFCGEAGTVVHNNTSDYKQHWDWNVLCLKDGCGGTGPYADTREIAIERWNQRFSEAALTSQASHIVRMREALEPFAKRAEYFDARLKANGGKWDDFDGYVDEPPSDLMIGQLRAARQAISPPLPESAERVRAMEWIVKTGLALQDAKDARTKFYREEKAWSYNCEVEDRVIVADKEHASALTAYRGGGKDTE